MASALFPWTGGLEYFFPLVRSSAAINRNSVLLTTLTGACREDPLVRFADLYVHLSGSNDVEVKQVAGQSQGENYV
jgi:hypothetical protein